MHRQTLGLVARRRGDTPRFRLAGTVPVYLADDIAGDRRVHLCLTRWARTPGLQLENLARVDVIARRPELDHLGLYDLYHSGIVLTWPRRPRRGLAGWASRLSAEFTFYHEVGHHACGHVEGGTVAAQEREADDYARTMFRRAHPVLTAVGRRLLRPLRPVFKRIVASYASPRDKIRLSGRFP